MSLSTPRNTIDQLDRFAELAAKRSIANIFRVFKRQLILGFVASLMVALGSLQQTSPFTSKVVGSWWLGIASPGSLPSKRFAFPAEVMVIAGLVLSVVVWLDVLRIVRAHRSIPLAAFWYLGAAWVLPLAIAGPLFSKDIYSYAALGEMVSHHISPYKYGPNVLGGTSYLTTVDPFWGNAKTPYGPFFVGLAALITTITMHHAFATMVGLRILALVSAIGVAFYIPRLAESYGFDKGVAFTLAVLNPVTIFHLISPGHNDILMLAFLLAGLYYARISRPVLGVVLVTLAALVKVPAELAVVYIGWQWLGEDRPVKERIRPVVTAFVISGIVMELAAKITGLGWGWILALSTPGQVRSPAVPTTALAIWLHDLSRLVGHSVSVGTFLTPTRLLGFAISGAGALYFLWHSKHYGTIKAIGYSFLVVTLFAPVIQPWYIAWGLVFLAVVPTRRVQWGIVYVSIAAMVLGLPGGPPIIATVFYVILVISASLYLAVRFKLVSRERLSPLLERLSGQVRTI